jgi:uncharacterized protein with ParB-like and HNH nuclease domain
MTMAKTTLYLYDIHSICSLMESGKIVVPAFQRGFVWSKVQVLNLLHSIHHGYPIGTIIVLEQPSIRVTAPRAKETLFPNATDQTSSHVYIWSVIDGSQRLAALYSSLFAREREVRYFFDLETEEFSASRRVRQDSRYVDLHSLYSTEEFIQYQRLVSSSEYRESLMDKVLSLHRAFKDYQIPVQVLADISLDEAASIFRQLNMSGRPLRKSDIEKAPIKKARARKRPS